MRALKSLSTLSLILCCSIPAWSADNGYYSADLDEAIAAAKHKPKATNQTNTTRRRIRSDLTSLNFTPVSNQELGQRVILGAIAPTASSGMANTTITKIPAKLTPIESLADIAIGQNQSKTQSNHSAISNTNADKQRGERLDEVIKLDAGLELILLEISDTKNDYGQTVIKNAGGQPLIIKGTVCQTHCNPNLR